MESIKLTAANLPAIAKTGAVVPGYDRSKLASNIVHIGLGHFHRSHQALYLDELLSGGLCSSGIFEINLIPDSFPLAEILAEQDYLYTLITKSALGETRVRVIGAITGYLNASLDKQKAIERVAGAETTLVTLTVTEKGYHYDAKTGDINRGEKAVIHDLEHPEEPETAAGFLAACLFLRRKNGAGPLTIMSCDNIPSNGKLLRACVLSFCKAAHPEILPWVEKNVSFPSSMVDRITPGTTPGLIQELAEKHCITDRWPVCGEDFRQWALEKNFKTEIPDYAKAGVQIAADVEPYELMKMRLLNGSHSAMAYPSYLLGHRRVDEGITDPLIHDFIRRHYMEEVSPTLAPAPGIDFTVYKDTLVSRFSNKNISDTILRLASEGSSKLPNFTLKPLAEAIRKGLPHDSIAFALAGWARFLGGTKEAGGADEQGQIIPLEDVNGPALAAAAKTAGSSPENFLTVIGLQGLQAEEFSAFSGRFGFWLERIYNKGIKAALTEFLN
jgi:mannitol-1-phosphate/altronate dehydrogenase